MSGHGAGVNSIEVLKDGLVGRGVLLDIPRLRGGAWLEPGEHVFAEDLEAAEREQCVSVGEGEILLVRTGHSRRLAELGPWNTRESKAGLHPTASACERARRWEFLFVAAPLRILGGTGSPINPRAVL